MQTQGSKHKKILFLAIIFIAVFCAPGAKAVNVGDYVNFNVEEKFEKNENPQVQALLVKTTAKLHFYLEKSWWEAQVPARKGEVLISLDALSAEFEKNIYPTLTSVFGSEWTPGVDGDAKITILLHSMKDGVGGYFRSADEYIKLQVPHSNEREMLYLPVSQLDNMLRLKVFLAHEFVHLITFNQKDRLQGVQEDIWLNEARADYAPTILGYDAAYSGSNLQNRVKDFVEKPTDSLVEWQETKYDYGVNAAFINYLVDHYGINILSDSLLLKSNGITSINEMLFENGYKEDFGNIFTNWTVALVLSDCSGTFKYCYFNKNFANFRINPSLVFLPTAGSSSLSLTNVTKNWAGNWQKIIGGNGDLKLKFSSLQGLDFKVPYILFDKTNHYTVKFLSLDENQQGEIHIPDFGANYASLVMISSLQTKTSGFNGMEATYPYTLNISMAGEASPDEQDLIQQLLAQIETLKKQIADLQAANNPSSFSCAQITVNLYVGVQNKNQVACLQEFLKSEGPAIYPEALVTGNFYALTKSAVVRFQKKHGIIQTGFVGILTRAKINQMLNTQTLY